MKARWTRRALRDLDRIYDFIALSNPSTAEKTIRKLKQETDILDRHPRLGPVIEGYEPREVRRLISGAYEIRYEIRDGAIYVIQLWHAREDR